MAMFHLFAVVGLDKSMASLVTPAVRRRLSGDSGVCQFLGVRSTFGELYSAEYIESVFSYIRREFEKRDVAEPISVIVAYNSISNFDFARRACIPFALPVKYELTGSSRVSQNEKRRLLNVLVEHLEKIFVSARAKTKDIYNHFSSNVRTTPFLLPVHNFSAQIMTPFLLDFVEEVQVKEAGIALKEARARFDASNKKILAPEQRDPFT